MTSTSLGKDKGVGEGESAKKGGEKTRNEYLSKVG